MSTDKTQTMRNDIAKAEEQIRQLQNRQKILLNKKADAERKARTHRLIERGAILESTFPAVAAMTSEEVKAFLLALSRLPGVGAATKEHRSGGRGNPLA